MANRTTENARCNLGCGNPTLTRAAAQDQLACPTRQSRQEHHRYLGFPKALSVTGSTNNHRRRKHAEAFFARSKAR